MYLDFKDPRALLSACTAIAMYDAAPGLTLAPIGFQLEPTGRAQLMRTGSGFWRADHGAPFAIDKKLLATIVRNTQIRGRTLRGDYFHWSNQDRNDPEDYRPAGYIDPRQLTIEPWKSPEGVREWGTFSPVSWVPEAKALIDRGVNQISPVIDWAHRLRWDCGPEYPAGTLIGPTITKWSLVDEGFFWMDPARYYANNQGAEELLYREVSMLSIDELLALIESLRKAGTPDDKIIALIKATLNGADMSTPEPAPGADATATAGMSATVPEGQGAAPITMAARLYQMLGGANTPTPQRTAAPAQPSRVAAPTTHQDRPLIDALLGAIRTTPNTPAATPQRTAAPSAAAFSLADIQAAVTSAVNTGLAPIIKRVDNLDINARVAQFSAAEAAGLHAGLDQETAAHLFVSSPSAYESFIAKRQALVGSAPGAQVAGASPMVRAFSNAEPVDSRQQLANVALSYQNDPKNVINGRKPSYDASLAYAIGVQTNQRRARGEQI